MGPEYYSQIAQRAATPRTLLRLAPTFICFLLLLGLPLLYWVSNVYGQSGEVITWEEPINISGPADDPASQPYILADPAGKAHLFWSQRFNQSFGEPDTVMYASWDGTNWSTPIDIFVTNTPVLPGIGYPTAVIDDDGYIHLIWLDQNWPAYTLNYSTVHATQASNANAWETRFLLAEDATGTNYSIDMAYQSPDTLHVVYGRVEQGQSPPEQRALTYIRSADAGVTWSRPVDLFTVPELQSGVSNSRILTDGDHIYVTWTEWDETGNGQAVYFVRSLDSGVTWDDPIMLARTPPGDYERDWPNLVKLEEDTIAVMWEGGFRAYRHTMYSNDAGETWSAPIDTFPGLIGENGYAEFIRDSNDTLHVFLAQRIREGNPSGLSGGLGLWHSVWQGGTQWSRPSLSLRPFDMVYPAVNIVSGNQVVAAWFSFNALQLMVMSGEIVDAPPIQAQPWPVDTPTPTPTMAATATATPPVPSPTPEQTLGSGSLSPSPPAARSMGTQTILLLGVLPTIVLLIAVTIIYVARQRRHWGR